MKNKLKMLSQTPLSLNQKEEQKERKVIFWEKLLLTTIRACHNNNTAAHSKSSGYLVFSQTKVNKCFESALRVSTKVISQITYRSIDI
jgi:hypothetical protein